MSITEADLDRWFTYHPPTPEQRAIYDRITEATRAAAEAIANGGHGLGRALLLVDTTIESECPDGAEQKYALEEVAWCWEVSWDDLPAALMHLRAARMWANAAIACAPQGDEAA